MKLLDVMPKPTVKNFSKMEIDYVCNVKWYGDKNAILILRKILENRTMKVKIINIFLRRVYRI